MFCSEHLLQDADEGIARISDTNPNMIIVARGNVARIAGICNISVQYFTLAGRVSIL